MRTVRDLMTPQVRVIHKDLFYGHLCAQFPQDVFYRNACTLDDRLAEHNGRIDLNSFVSHEAPI